MTPSQACYSLTERSEGCKLTAYRDGAGIWTIGYGHTKGVRPGQTITQETAQILLEHDMAYAAGFVSAHGGSCTQNQFDAMTDFTFNVGPANFLSSTLLKKHLAGDYQGAGDEFLRWKYDHNHNVEPGLVARREAERALYLGE